MKDAKLSFFLKGVEVSRGRVFKNRFVAGSGRSALGDEVSGMADTLTGGGSGTLNPSASSAIALLSAAAFTARRWPGLVKLTSQFS